MTIQNLDLLDIFAAAALVGLLAKDGEQTFQKADHKKWLAFLAYQYAEEMIEAKLDLEEQ